MAQHGQTLFRLITVFLCSLMVPMAQAASMSRAQVVDANTSPIGQVDVAGESARGAMDMDVGVITGEQRYDMSCGFCHDSGAGGSPSLNDASAWTSRLAQSYEVLLDHTLNGLNAMPAKGLCPQCDDDEIESALQYMLDRLQ